MSGWDELRARCGEPTEMVRRDALRVGDRALSSHYGLRTVAEVAQFGRNGETTWIRWSGGTSDYVPHERYDSASLIPRVVVPDAAGASPSREDEGMTERANELDVLLESYDLDTLGDDPAEFDEWLALYDERERLRR